MERKREYAFADDFGDAKISVYSSGDGLEAAYVAAHMGELDFGLFEKSVDCHYIGVHYCKEGQIEQALGDEFLYLMAGDCVVAVQDRQVKRFAFPMKHYHGVSIGIDLRRADGELLRFLKSCGLEPTEAAGKLCGGENYAVLRGRRALREFFEDIYGAPDDVRAEYLKIKLPELFFLLKNSDENDGDRTMVPRVQVELVKRVAGYISEHINGKISVKDLTAVFGVSGTYLQGAFRNVYGMPVISFIRAQKMQSAAQILIHTEKSVGEIAGEFGYENESKFSAAFKKVIGDTPGGYRREHSKIKIL